jgi:MFS family permease
MSKPIINPAKVQPGEWQQGWRSVLATALGTATGLSLFAYVTSLFIRPYVAEFGWSRAEIGAASFATLGAGLLAPLIGRLADRFGIRAVIAGSALGFGLSCWGMASQNGDIRVYWALYFALVFTGLGTTGLCWTRGIVASFEHARGLALSVALSAVTLSAVATPPLLEWIIASKGWRSGWLTLGVIGVLGGIAGLMILPKRLGLPPAKTAARADLSGALKAPAFWLAVTGMFLINVPSGGIMNQMAAIIESKRVLSSVAAQVMSAFAASVFLGRLMAGALLDRLAANHVAWWAFALPGVGCLILAEAGGAVLIAIIAGIVFAGLSQGAEGDIGPYVLSRRFGLAAFNSMMGALSAATVVGTAVGGYMFGRIHDLDGSYDRALWIGAVCFLAGAMCYLFIRTGPPASRPVID